MILPNFLDGPAVERFPLTDFDAARAIGKESLSLRANANDAEKPVAAIGRGNGRAGGRATRRRK